LLMRLNLVSLVMSNKIASLPKSLMQSKKQRKASNFSVGNF